MKMTTFSKLFLAGVMAFAVTTGTTACGTRTYTELPGEEQEAPVGDGGFVVTVIDHTSSPVPGAFVTVSDAQGAPVGEETQTDASGKATFKSVPLGSGYTVTAEDGGITGSQAGLGVDGAGPVMVTLMLVPVNGAKGTVGGTVVDGLSGQPIEGASVAVAGVQKTVTTRGDGSFVLADVPVGSPTVVAKIGGYREARQNVSLQGGKLERVTLKLFPTGNVARMGHTVITTGKGVLEFDKWMNRVAGARGASQARALPNGNFLMASGSGVLEVNASNMAVWTYRPLLVGRLGNPQGVDRAESGSVFVADTDNNRVLELNPNRKVERKLKVSFNHPMGVDYVEQTRTVLVADTGNHRVVEIGPDGKIVWGVGDGTTGLLNRPTYAQRLANGNTLITDTGNHRVMEINARLQLVWMYGGKGDRAQCFLPNSAVRLPNGNTLIADTGNDRVIEVNGKGEQVWMLPGVAQPLFAERL